MYMCNSSIYQKIELFICVSSNEWKHIASIALLVYCDSLSAFEKKYELILN